MNFAVDYWPLWFNNMNHQIKANTGNSMNETTLSKDAPSVDLGDLHELIASVAVTWCADECGINPEEWVYTFQSGHVEMSPVTNEESGLVTSDIQDCLDHQFNEQQMEIDLDKLENAA